MSSVARLRRLVTSGGVSAVSDASARPTNDETASAGRPPGGPPRSQTAITVGLAACLVAITFVTGGGVDQNVATSGNTWTEIVLTVVGAVGIGAGVLLRPAGARRFGWLAAGLMLVMFALEAASIAWSVAPDASWIGASQMLAYTTVFIAAILLARPLAARWAALLGALALWAVALSAWSLIVKVFPSALAPGNQIGRLQAPFGYWNAIALTAAMGVPCCLWLGARRDAGRRLAALAAPALTLLVSVLVLSYSRSADAAAAVGAGVWLLVVPLRLRAIAVLVLGFAGGAVISAWMLTHHALSHDKVPMSAQDHAGHVFGIVIVVVLVLVSVAGVAVTEAMDRTTIAPQTRRRAGSALVALLGIAVVGAVAAVAASSRGLFGEISYRWHELTNPNATVSASNASRVFQFGSSRPLYWHEALFVGHTHYWKGVGELGFSVARLLDPASSSPVFQAHSYVFETYADLGTLGLVVTAALLLAWLVAGARSVALGRPWNTLSAAGYSERIALATLFALVLAFGVQGTLDWTWFFTGLTVPALLAAGWLAGRGPGAAASGSSAATAGATVVRLGDRGNSGLAAEPGAPADGTAAVPAQRRSRSLLDRPAALGFCALLAVAVLLGAWMTWRPLDSAQLAENATTLATANAARSAEPFSLLPYETLSAFELDLHRPVAAVAELQRGTREQPRNPYSWYLLMELEARLHNWPMVLSTAQRVRLLDAAPGFMLSGADNEIVAYAKHEQRSAKHKG